MTSAESYKHPLYLGESEMTKLEVADNFCAEMGEWKIRQVRPGVWQFDDKPECYAITLYYNKRGFTVFGVYRDYDEEKK